MLQTRTLPDHEEARRLVAIEEARAFETFAAVELERIEGRNGLLCFTPDGSLWVQVERIYVTEQPREAIRVTFEGDPITPRYLAPAAEVRPGTPATLAEWAERERQREAARERSREQHRAEVEAKRATAEVVTANEAGLPSDLRAVAIRLLDLGGDIRASGGRRVVALPPSENAPDGFGMRLARYVYLGEEHVLAAAKRNGELDPGKIPDRPLLPSGALAP